MLYGASKNFLAFKCGKLTCVGIRYIDENIAVREDTK